MATVIILPVVLLGLWLGLQAALVAHARHVVQAAAQDAAIAAASDSGDPGDVATSVVGSSAGGLTSDVGVSVGHDGEQITVTVTADVTSIIPFASFGVNESAAAPVELFVPEPERP